MVNPMKISSVQIFWLMISMEIGMTVLLTITPAIRAAKQDAWISMLIAAVAGILITFIATKLSLLYPNQTLIQFSQTILGKWLGKAIVVPYFVMWYSVMGIILRQSSDFIQIVLFRKTPLWAVVLLALILMIYATYQGGIEGIGRCSELLGPFIVLMITAVLVLCYHNMHWTRILPVYQDSGWFTIFKGAVSPISFLGESVMMTMLVAFMSKPKDGLSRAMWGVGLSCLLLLLSTLAAILTFGNLASRMWYPFFDMARYVSVMDFIQNIDAVVVIVWLLSVFIKLSLYMFIASYGTAQWLGMKDWRKPIWFISPIVFVLALLPANIDVASMDYPTKFWIPYILPINIVGIPVLLWTVGSIRKKWAK
ncbi:spore germination protein [Alicyclobacillus fastidiosus]|uniref:Spore germination protein n=1 Tax=Alicyclobacillus fastidiosus TaxID=392011 RepID=A0ABY6ZB54_9BACL|nr:endospore germination permease [Alicyclobacillus fastidiosus]WAH40067.1 spore germination protein [Alicyclobacillus fastidiosus]GMA61380.1 germination protein [Alicyclobacillus fastidiosus]